MPAYPESTATPVVVVADHSSGGSVTISGTPAVTISGTPAVTVSGTPTVQESGRAMVVPMVDGAAVNFLRRYVFTTAGAISSVTDTQLDGTTAYTAVGTVWPFNPLVATRPNMVTATHRYTSASNGTVVAAGALSVELLVIADTVTITTNSGGAITIPANTAITFQQEGWGTPAITLGITGSGDVLVIENRVS